MDLTTAFSSSDNLFHSSSASAYSSSERESQNSFYSSVHSPSFLSYLAFFFLEPSETRASISSSDNSDKASHYSGVMDLTTAFSSSDNLFHSSSASAYSSSERESQNSFYSSVHSPTFLSYLAFFFLEPSETRASPM